MDDDSVSQLELNEENEMQLCETSEPELEITKTTTEKSFSPVVKSNTNTKRKTKSSSKSKRNSIFKKHWIKDPQYARFL